MAGITHAFVSAIEDGEDATLVRPSDWNAEHEGATGRSVAFFIAANDATTLEKFQADYLCDGTNDHVEIQAALDVLPSTGGEVKLSSGTFNCQVAINLDSYQTLRGCGHSTILTTTTASLDFLKITGTSGNEKVKVMIADLQINGASTGRYGISLSYTDYSLFQNLYLHHLTSYAVPMSDCDKNRICDNVLQSNAYGVGLLTAYENTVSNNHCQGNTTAGIYFVSGYGNIISGNICYENVSGIRGYTGEASTKNTIIGNTCRANTGNGIYIYGTQDNEIIGNICSGNGLCGIYINDKAHRTSITGNVCESNTYSGIELNYDLDYCSVSNNHCYKNGRHGIYLIGVGASNHNSIIGNTCVANSQTTTNTYDDIQIDDLVSYSNIQGNTCRAGALTNKPRYGININSANCADNFVTNNDIDNDGFGTGSLYDSGTGTVTIAGNRT